MSDDTQMDVTAAKRRMDAALKAAQDATRVRIDAQTAERNAKAAARARTAEYVAAVTQQANAALGVKPRTAGKRRGDVGGDGAVHGGAQVFAMNGAR